MRQMHIDVETFSSADLASCGVYHYTEDPDFVLLLFGVSVDGGPVTVYDLASGEGLPPDILSALSDPSVIKWAHNAAFERITISRFLRDRNLLGEDAFLPPQQWRCTMTWAAYLGLPLSLAGAGSALGLPEQKMKEGKELIRYFCTPCKPTASNGGRTRNLPSHDPEKWDLFKRYNIRDVEVEIQIADRLASHPVPDFVWEEYFLDQEINDRGVSIDLPFVEKAIQIDGEVRAALTEEMQDLTSLDNPNSVQQLSRWLMNHDVPVSTLGKKDIKALLAETENPMVRKVLLLRQQLAKSSVKKYTAIQNAVCSDGRIRGMFVFYGANRSGRFTSRIAQLQNLPQNHLPDLDEARALVRTGDLPALQMLYEDVPDTLSQLIRTAFVPRSGDLFYVADFSAIEARVLAWLSGEQWVLDAFRNGEDLYCRTASQMFGVPVEKHGVNGDLRQKGKIATLACGYGGSTGALIAMGALENSLHEEELKPLAEAWRTANSNSVQLWWDVDKAVKKAIKHKSSTSAHGITFTCHSGMLYITLPSGRQLSYVQPQIGMNRFGGESVTYMGLDTTKHWTRIESYGPKFVENCVQGIARDILCYAMKNLRQYAICMHVHDEVIIEASPDTSLDDICSIMGRTPPWAEGLPLRADGYTAVTYRKD